MYQNCIEVKELNAQWEESTMKVIEKNHQFTTMLDESRKLKEVNNDFLGKIVEMENKIDNLPEQSSGKETLRKQKIEFKVMNHFKEKIISLYIFQACFILNS